MPLNRDAHKFASEVRADVHAALSPATFLDPQNQGPSAEVAGKINLAGDVAYTRFVLSPTAAASETFRVLNDAGLGKIYPAGERLRVSGICVSCLAKLPWHETDCPECVSR